ARRPAAGRGGGARVSARPVRREARSGGECVVGGGAAVGYLPAGGPARAQHEGARVRRHGERLAPPPPPLCAAGAAPPPGGVAGATLVGEPSTYLLEPTTQVTGAPWATAAGVVLFGVGLYIHLSAPPRSLGWMLFVMFVALAAQRLGAGLFGSMISGFFGTLV